MSVEISGKPLYPVPELSKKLNVTKVTIRNYLKQGKLKGQKAMGKCFVSNEGLREFFEDS